MGASTSVSCRCSSKCACARSSNAGGCATDSSKPAAPQKASTQRPARQHSCNKSALSLSLTCWFRRPAAAGLPSRGPPAPEERAQDGTPWMLPGPSPAPMPVFAPIMPQCDRSGRCFLHMASVNEFRLRGWGLLLLLQTGDSCLMQGLHPRIQRHTHRSSICAAKASSAARLSWEFAA